MSGSCFNHLGLKLNHSKRGNIKPRKARKARKWREEEFRVFSAFRGKKGVKKHERHENCWKYDPFVKKKSVVHKSVLNETQLVELSSFLSG